MHLFGAHLKDLSKIHHSFLIWNLSPFSSLFQHDFFILQNISMDTSILYNLLCWLQNAMFYKNTQFIVICINYYWLCPDYWQMIESRISFWFYLEMHGNTELIINDWSVKNNLYNFVNISELAEDNLTTEKEMSFVSESWTIFTTMGSGSTISLVTTENQSFVRVKNVRKKDWNEVVWNQPGYDQLVMPNVSSLQYLFYYYCKRVINTEIYNSLPY